MSVQEDTSLVFADVTILDGPAAIANMLKPGSYRTFRE